MKFLNSISSLLVPLILLGAMFTLYSNISLARGTSAGSITISSSGIIATTAKQEKIKSIQMYRIYSLDSSNARTALNDLQMQIPSANTIFIDVWVDAEGTYRLTLHR